MSAPLFEVPSTETLPERCARLAAELDAWERDIAAGRGRLVLVVTEVRQALADAAQALQEVTRG